MQRRKQNSSRFDRRSRTIFWHVHWRFPAASESVRDLRVSEQTPLKQVLQQHISLVPGNSLKRHALRMYVEAGLENLQIVMKKEHCPVSLFLACLTAYTSCFTCIVNLSGAHACSSAVLKSKIYHPCEGFHV